MYASFMTRVDESAAELVLEVGVLPAVAMAISATEYVPRGATDTHESAKYKERNSG
jgi:hypothetical protein